MHGHLVGNHSKMERTWGKSIFLHFVPVVQKSRKVVPSCAPLGADCSAIQFISAVEFEPLLYSEIQTRNWVLSADSTQIAAPLPRAWLLTEWPKEAKIFTCFPPKNGSANVIVSQTNNPGLLTVTLVFPALKLTAIREKKKKKEKNKLPLALGLRWLHYF